MMQVFKVGLGFSILMSLGLCNLTAQTVDEILQKHKEAIGYSTRTAHKTITSIGKLTQMGSTLPISIIQKRPNLYRMDVHLPGARVTTAFDGKSGWSYNPFLSEDTVLLDGFELKQLKESSIFDGILVMGKDLGYQIRLEGKVIWNNQEVFRLIMTKPSSEMITFYLNSKSFLVVKTEVEFLIDGFRVSAESRFSDFRTVQGLTLPFHITNTNGQLVAEIQFEQVRLNETLDDPLFKTLKTN